MPAAFVDLDGDGSSELISDGPPAFDYGAERAIVRVRDGLWNEIDTLSVPYLDCPC